MKRLIYMSSITENSPSIGVWKKIQMQKNYFEKNNIRVEFYEIKQNSGILWGFLRRLPFTGLNKWLNDKDEIKNIDCVYIRYTGADYQLIRSLKKMKKYNKKIKILIEIPTYPYEYEGEFSYGNCLLTLKDKWNRRKLCKYVDFILTYSDDNTIFNIPTIQLSNAVDINTITIKKSFLSDNKINIIAVASFAYWHGYDRFIKGLNRYNKSNEENKLVINLHLVGEGSEIEKYKALVDKYNLGKCVFFYGRREGKELDDIYDKCEIALDAMGRHRSKVYYNSTLKGKEYGAKGLPIISGVKTELDLDRNYKYYMRIPADESPVDIKKVINFYNQIYYSGDSREDIALKIRSYSKSKFDISVAWKKVADLINI